MGIFDPPNPPDYDDGPDLADEEECHLAEQEEEELALSLFLIETMDREGLPTGEQE